MEGFLEEMYENFVGTQETVSAKWSAHHYIEFTVSPR